MKPIILSVPDNDYSYYINFFKRIPNIKIENDSDSEVSVPEFHTPILNQRLDEHHKNPNTGTDWDEFEKNELDNL